MNDHASTSQLTVDNATAILNRLRSTYRHIPASIFHLGETIERKRQEGVAGKNQYQSSVCELLLAAMACLQSFTYHEARTLVGMLSYSQENPRRLTQEQLFTHQVIHQSAAMREYAEILSRLYGLRIAAIGFGPPPQISPSFLLKEDPDLLEVYKQYNNLRCEFDTLFTTEALVLTRLAYMQGVNIVNPAWDSAQGRTGIDASTAFYLTVSDKVPTRSEHPALYIRPASPTSTIISYHCPSEKGIKTSLPKQIADGEALLIGRNLTLPNLFGLHDEQGLTAIPVHGRIDHGIWSRGCLIVARLDDKIYLLDRGTKNPFAFWEKTRRRGGSFLYHPEPYILQGTHISYGKVEAVR